MKALLSLPLLIIFTQTGALTTGKEELRKLWNRYFAIPWL